MLGYEKEVFCLFFFIKNPSHILTGRGAEAWQHMKHFSFSPSIDSSGCFSPPNRTVGVGYGIDACSTHFMGLKRACP